jgi:hypothetical protein
MFYRILGVNIHLPAVFSGEEKGTIGLTRTHVIHSVIQKDNQKAMGM